MDSTTVEQWLETTSGVLRRQRDDFEADLSSSLDQEQDHRKRRKVATQQLKLKRSRSDGDLPRILDMSNPSQDAMAMPPPPLPDSSRGSSRGRRRSSQRGSQDAPTHTRTDGTTTGTYRANVLEPNSVFIRHHTVDTGVLTAVKSILEGAPQQSSLRRWSIEEAQQMAFGSCEVENEAEEKVIDLCLKAFPVPLSPNSQGQLAVTRKLPFSLDCMPYVPGGWLGEGPQPRISNPFPDLLFGYALKTFTLEQRRCMTGLERLADRVLGTTARELLCAFFAVEFKAQATGGSIYAATNQCAGAGAACVNALKMIYELAPTPIDEGPTSNADSGGHLPSPRSSPNIVAATAPSAADSLCFTMAIDGQTAALHANWTDGAGAFYCSRVRHYVLFEAEGAQALKREVDAVIAWGLGPRLTAIRNALDERVGRARAVLLQRQQQQQQQEEREQ